MPVITPRAATLLGAGRVEDLGMRIEEEEVELAIVDAPLTPIQQRNLERAWKIKVLDRTALILEIFGDRAQTREGVLQVDLGASRVPEEPAGAQLDAPRTSARRRRLHGRSGRDADGGGPANHLRKDPEAEAAAGEGRPDARTASRGRARKRRMPSSRWSATPTPANRRCSIG